MIPDKKTLANITCIISDVDGVMTDGRLYFGEQEEPLRAFHIHDGLGIRNWLASGGHFAIITAKKSHAVHKRFSDLGVTHIYQGERDKQNAYQDLKNKLGLDDHQCAYIGDDLPDLPVMKMVGLSAAPADAVPIVRETASWVLMQPGGKGAVRALCDGLLESRV